MRDGLQPDGTPTLVYQGLQAFGQTAQDIIACKATRIWPAPTGAEVPEERSCNICASGGTAHRTTRALPGSPFSVMDNGFPHPSV